MLHAALESINLILDSMPMRVYRTPEAAYEAYVAACKDLSQRMAQVRTPVDLLSIAGEMVETVEEYALRTKEYFREQGEHMQAILRMLTEALAEFSGRSDASVVHLQDIEKRIEAAYELDDIKTLRSNLQSCLTSLREACAEEKKDASESIQRLKAQLDQAQTQFDAGRSSAPREAGRAPQPADFEIAAPLESFVAAFKLQHADHIASRFGESVRRDMLAMISKNLKALLGPGDRIVRWKGTSLVVFLYSRSGMKVVRAQLSEAVSSTRQQYINVGSRSALLSVGVDWTVFPQSHFPSLNDVLAEVDKFLAEAVPKNASWSASL